MGRLLISSLLVSGWLAAQFLADSALGDAGGRAPEHDLMIVALLITATLGVVHLRNDTKASDLFRPSSAFPAAYTIWFSLGCMDFIPRSPDTDLWDPMPGYVLELAALGLGAYLLGVLTVGGSVRSLQPADIQRVFRRWNRSRVRTIGVTLLGITFGSYAALVARVGIPVLSADPSVARLATAEHVISLSVFYSGALAFVPMSLAWIWSQQEPATADRVTVYSLNALLFLSLFSLANRGVVLQPALLGLLVAHYVRKRLRLRIILITGVCALVFLSSLGLWRDVSHYGPSHVAKITSWGFPLWSLPIVYIFTYVRSSVATFRDVIETIPRFVPFQHGWILASPILTALPGRQETSDLFFKRILHSEFVGFGQPATLLGSLYADLGPCAIVVGMLSFGFLSQWVYRRLNWQPSAFRTLLNIWLVQTGLMSLFSSLLPYPTTIFVPFLIWFLSALCTSSHLRSTPVRVGAS